VPSQSLTDFEDRLGEVQQLLDAHSALTRLRRAEAATANGVPDLQTLLFRTWLLRQVGGDPPKFTRSIAQRLHFCPHTLKGS